MLNREQAEKRLKAFQVKGREKAFVAALGKLPAGLKAIGMAILGRNPEGKSFKDWQARNKAQEAVALALTGASAKDRGRLFAVLFPKLAQYVEAGWQLWQKLPYEIDYDRKGFRAPSDPTVHKDARWGW